MANRLAGFVATLWFFFALLSLFIALALSPMGLGLLLPDTHPITWVYPALLALPPIALVCQKFVSTQVFRVVFWALALSLAVVGLALFAFLFGVFLGH